MIRALLLLSLLLSACTSTTGTREGAWPNRDVGVVLPPEPEPAERPAEPASPPPTPVPLPPPPVVMAPSTPRQAEQISGQAVISLLRQARESRAAGQYDQASAQLERALRIEPRNYFVWSMLAAVYLEQGQPDQAQSVASRANSLARGNVYVELENWRTIGRAREQLGDAAGALQARLRVEQIEAQLAATTPAP